MPGSIGNSLNVSMVDLELVVLGEWGFPMLKEPAATSRGMCTATHTYGHTHTQGNISAYLDLGSLEPRNSFGRENMKPQQLPSGPVGEWG